MKNLNADSITQAFIDRIGDETDPRFREIITSLVRHLHDFAREVRLTPEELLYGVRFLQRVGQWSDDKREEGVLLSDTSGLTMLVDAMANKKPTGATESSVLGPFWRDGAPVLGSKGNIADGNDGELLIVSGRVTTPDGKPIAGAVLDFWQTASNGLYESQDDRQPDMNLRGKLVTDEDGRYELTTVKPVSYEVPTDGPAGEVLRAMGRHAWRPSHLHVIVAADGYVPTTTMLFDDADPYIEEDAVFGVKDSLIVHYDECNDEEEAKRRGIKTPFFTVTYDFGLVPADQAAAA